MTAIQILIEHAKETHPHFESPRGQMDIDNAQREWQALNRVVEVAKAYREAVKAHRYAKMSPGDCTQEANLMVQLETELKLRQDTLENLRKQ